MATVKTIQVTPEMEQILQAAEKFGFEGPREEFVLSALQDWWGDRLIDSIGADEVRRMLEEAAEDNSPGLDPDEVFAQLKAEIRAMEQEKADAA